MRTEIVTLRFDDRLDIADDIMTLGRIRHLPVVDGDGRLLGIVSQRDLLRASVSSVLELGAAGNREWLQKIPVGAIMKTPVVTAGPEEPVSTVVERMIEMKVGCVAVVEGGHLTGLVTETDCLHVLGDLLRPRH